MLVLRWGVGIVARHLVRRKSIAAGGSLGNGRIAVEFVKAVGIHVDIQRRNLRRDLAQNNSLTAYDAFDAAQGTNPTEMGLADMRPAQLARLLVPIRHLHFRFKGDFL